MAKDYKKKVLMAASGGSVETEDDKANRLKRFAKNYPDPYGALPVTVKDRKTGKIDVEASVKMGGRNEAEGLYQKLDRRFQTLSPMSKRYKAKDDRKKGGN